MSSASKRRQSGGGDGGGEGANWMDTYGDLVTLLLCFFVLLFSFSSIDSQKWEAIVGALSGSNSIVIPAFSPETAMERPIELIMTTTPSQEDAEVSEEDPGQIQQIDYQNFLTLYENIAKYVGENNTQAEVMASFESFTIIIRFTDDILFASGRAELLPESLPVMNSVIDVLALNQDLISMIRIEGHTDNRPIHTSQFNNNWDLSVSRAVRTLEYFLNSGRIEATKISAVGYGEFHPVLPNDSDEGRAKNRRVDFVVEGYVRSLKG